MVLLLALALIGATPEPAETSAQMQDFAQIFGNSAIYFDGDPRVICRSDMKCVQRQLENIEKLKRIQHNLIKDAGVAIERGNESGVVEAKLQALRFSTCVAENAREGTEVDANKAQECWLHDRTRPIPGVAQRPTFLGFDNDTQP
jgi:hypothetical protein